jgi:hypothetical protein
MTAGPDVLRSNRSLSSYRARSRYTVPGVLRFVPSIPLVPSHGRLKWQTSTGYGNRALVETAMSRYKGVIGPRLRARSFRAQQTEAAIGVAILNRMLACGRPKSVRCQASAGATK